jgi:hypothetical protein
MRKPRWYDWLGATAVWGMISTFTGVFLHEGLGAPEEVGVMAFLALFVGGLAGARVWWLRRPLGDMEGLTTGEVQLARFEELEMRVAELESAHSRIAELEDRLDFSERLLASRGEHHPMEQPRG